MIFKLVQKAKAPTEAALLREKDDCSQHRRCKAERDDAPTIEAVVFHEGRINMVVKARLVQFVPKLGQPYSERLWPGSERLWAPVPKPEHHTRRNAGV